jgi:hypothetical protein
MTMHLQQGLSTLNTRKPKQKKLSVAQHQKLETEWRQYNKEMRRKNMHSLQWDTLEEYIAYTKGNGAKRTRPEKQVAPEVKTFEYKLPDTSRGKEYKSRDSGNGVALKREPNKYTGTLIKGIATMHKSNAVPIINQEQATEIANMRRN